MVNHQSLQLLLTSSVFSDTVIYHIAYVRPMGYEAFMPFQNSMVDCWSSSTETETFFDSRRGLERMECHICMRQFSGPNRKFLLTRHMITHTSHRPFHCDQCPYRANVASNLRRHVKMVHAAQKAAPPPDSVPQS